MSSTITRSAEPADPTAAAIAAQAATASSSASRASITAIVAPEAMKRRPAASARRAAITRRPVRSINGANSLR
ncbi:hypothetical protein ACFSTI_17680 [Rhizorhabdus histidinilytica]